MAESDFYFDIPQPVTEKQKVALAKMFADEEVRGYLVHAIQVANQNSLKSLRADNAVLAKQYSVRADTLEVLLKTSKLWYMHYDEIKKQKKLSTSQ